MAGLGKKLAGWGKSWQVCKNSWQVGKKVGRLRILKFEVRNYLKAVRLRELVFGKVLRMEICGCVGRFMKSKLHNGIIQWGLKK